MQNTDFIARCIAANALIDSTHKLSADLVDDTNSINKFATAEQLQQIETNKTNILMFYPTSYTVPTSPPNITITSGGYVVCGNMVIVNIRINTTSDLIGVAPLCSDLPIPLGDPAMPIGSSVVSTSNSKGIAISITTEGVMIVNTNNTLSSGTTIISAIYIKTPT